MRTVIVGLGVIVLVALGGSLAAQGPTPCPCQHVIPCQHQVPCGHPLHPFDTIQGFCPTPYGVQACPQVVPCAHRMHAYDTLHPADTAHPYDICIM
jgi:hypothetical protein